MPLFCQRPIYGARHSFVNVRIRVGGAWTAVPSQKSAVCQRDGVRIITEFTEVKKALDFWQTDLDQR